MANAKARTILLGTQIPKEGVRPEWGAGAQKCRCAPTGRELVLFSARGSPSQAPHLPGLLVVWLWMRLLPAGCCPPHASRLPGHRVPWAELGRHCLSWGVDWMQGPRQESHGCVGTSGRAPRRHTCAALCAVLWGEPPHFPGRKPHSCPDPDCPAQLCAGSRG